MDRSASSPLPGRQLLVTREFAQALDGKKPHPYLRTEQDPVQQFIAHVAGDENASHTSAGIYAQRMLPFWRELSIAGLRREGRGADEVFALLFESAFEFAMLDISWSAEALALSDHQATADALDYLAHTIANNPISHDLLVRAMQVINAPSRERTSAWNDARGVVEISEVWFWAALTLAAEVSTAHPLARLRERVKAAASGHWEDRRLHTELIRRAPREAATTPNAELMAHPLLRMARLKYRPGGAEERAVLRFLTERAIEQGFESETDIFISLLILAQWVRDARRWAEETLVDEADMWTEIQEEPRGALRSTYALFHRLFGVLPAATDDIDCTAALVAWANSQRGFEVSSYRAEAMEFIINVVDAALWLGWMFPRNPPARNPLDAE